MKVSKYLSGIGALALAAAPALVVAPSGAQAVAPVVAQFTEPGSADFTVPDDVRCVEVVAIGAQGGSASDGVGGLGGSVLKEIEVLPGQSLQVNVGGRGGDASGATGGAGGVNGGGAGGTSIVVGGGGGGGASDVRQGGSGLADRAIVAAGGGGAGAFGVVDGGDGGNPGEDGATFSPEPSEPGGGGATVSGPGAGAPSASAPGVADGQSGTSGDGGAGGGGVTLFINGGGGGGGGGYFGGGGGAGVVSGGGPAGGGGGGSNFVAGFGAGGTTGVDADNGGDGRVTLSYVVGDDSCVQAPMTFTKVLAGAPLPAAGTTFTVDVQCDEAAIDLGSLGQPGTSDQVQLEFAVAADGTAQAVGPDTITFTGPTQCAVTEPGDGGAASTSFTCAGVEGGEQAVVFSPGESSWGPGASAVVTPDSPMCPVPGPSDGSILVNVVWPDQVAEVGVTNVFAAAAAVIAPKFTG